ncbi:MAG: sodium:calcium symporter [Chlorobiaceae bacterium]|nr:sodium:calcium symporter [Chlorobiaceae bacterium]MBA4310402.1 sodium:calcium symporter [Chlorobiaceae bacterium]
MATRDERWGTRVGLVLAMAGNAVGLGNFLRFPAQAAENGGGAFLIPYLISFLLMGIPLLWVEWAIGRNGGKYGHHSTPGMFDVMGKSKLLKYIGVFGLFTNITVASYYCYIESWTLAYVWHSLIGTFKEIAPTEFFPNYLGMHEGSIFALPMEAFFFFVITLALNVWILSRGLVKGIELAAKIGMPLLFLFGAILAIRGLTLDTSSPGVIESPMVGLNFVWEPNFTGLTNPTTWLAAAGQIFFTLSVGMGSIHCYAAYVKEKQDIALNGASAGWMNEFVEVILGGTILIPIATAYLGLNVVQAATMSGSGFGLGFLTLPTLFNNWGWFAPFAGVMWFGLLFFAGVTSSLAMGQPILAFLKDEFKIERKKGALIFGAIIFALGFICVWLYPGGSFDEFDFWTGTFALVLFAFLEIIVFAYVFGMKKGWDEITRGADIVVPKIYKFIIKYVTPVFIGVVFVGALIKPSGDWVSAFNYLFSGQGWPFAADSVIGMIFHVGVENYVWFVNGEPTKEFVKDLTRILLMVVFVSIMLLVHFAWKKKRKEGKA